MSLLAPTLQLFFTERLAKQRQASPRTVISYRDTFRLLLGFVADRTGKAPSTLGWEDVGAEVISAFLDHLEADRHNSARSRNTRLTCGRPTRTARGLPSRRSCGLCQIRVMHPAKKAEAPRSEAYFRLDVVVEHELPRVRPKPDGIDLGKALVADPRLDEVIGEHAAGLHEFVVLLERAERFVQRARHLRHACKLLGREVVQVLVHRLGWLDTVLHPIEAGHEHGREGKVRVAGRVRTAELDPLGLRALGVQRDPARS
jgi:hypothetical protein